MTGARDPRIRRVAAKAPATLRVTWHDGTSTTHDLSAMLRAPWAAPLRDPAMFVSATLEDGWQVVWPGTEAAVSARGLWDDLHPQTAVATWMSAKELRAWMQEMHLSFSDAADALGISKRMLKYYAAGSHTIPKVVWLACMQLAAEHSRSRVPADAL